MNPKPKNKPLQLKMYCCQCGRCAHLKVAVTRTRKGGLASPASLASQELKDRGWTKNAKGWRCRLCTEAAMIDAGIVQPLEEAVTTETTPQEVP